MLCINLWAQPHPATQVRGKWSTNWSSTSSSKSSKSPSSFIKCSPLCSFTVFIQPTSNCRWSIWNPNADNIHVPGNPLKYTISQDSSNYIRLNQGNEWVFRAIQNFLITKLALLLTTTISLLTSQYLKTKQNIYQRLFSILFWRTN